MLIWLAMVLKEVVVSINEEDSYAGYPHTSSPAILFVAVNSALLYVHNPGTSTMLIILMIFYFIASHSSAPSSMPASFSAVTAVAESVFYSPAS